MRVVILQPSYLPWLGFFDQLHRCDCFVIYDDVQYTRRDWRNRNRILTPQGLQWLTVPVLNKGRYHQSIAEAAIDYSQHWIRKHLNAMKLGYQHARFFADYYPTIEQILTQAPNLLLDLNLRLIRQIAAWLGITTPLIYASQLQATGSSTARLVDICRKLNATHYLTGNAANAYLDLTAFEIANIVVEYQNYQHPVYTQLSREFIPWLSIVDLLFNHGRDSLAILAGQPGANAHPTAGNRDNSSGSNYNFNSNHNFNSNNSFKDNAHNSSNQSNIELRNSENIR
jgi:WbqC-like protein family